MHRYAYSTTHRADNNNLMHRIAVCTAESKEAAKEFGRQEFAETYPRKELRTLVIIEIPETSINGIIPEFTLPNKLL